MTKTLFPIEASEPAARAVAFICRKCGATSDDLRGELKRAAKRDLPKKTLRVVLTDCQDVCPKKGTSMYLVAPGAASVFRVVKPDEVADVVRQIIGALK